MTAESAILTQIRLALAQHLKRDVSRVLPEHLLREDLGLDSLSTLELLFKLEEAFDLEIPNEDLPRLSTVASVATYIEQRLAAGDGHVPDAPGALAALASKAVAAAGPRPAAPRPAPPAPRPAPAPRSTTGSKPPAAKPSAAKPAAARRATAPKPAASKGARPAAKAKARHRA